MRVTHAACHARSALRLSPYRLLPVYWGTGPSCALMGVTWGSVLEGWVLVGYLLDNLHVASSSAPRASHVGFVAALVSQATVTSLVTRHV